MINCINFPCKVDNFSFVSIKSATHLQRWNHAGLWECIVSCKFTVQKHFDVSKQKICSSSSNSSGSGSSSSSNKKKKKKKNNNNNSILMY